MAVEISTQQLLLGNEAVALGALHAGVRVATGYPGTPSTEVIEYLAEVAPKDVQVHWATNEKVAWDEGIGASLAGARTLVTMKHVGLNVAMDAFMTSPLLGVNGGIVLLCADDPGMHSSQNEQDTRYLGKFAGVPMFEPSDSQEIYDFVRAAFEVSEAFDTPCLVRTTTRVSHSRSRVLVQAPVAVKERTFERNPAKYVMLPAYARLGRVRLLDRLPALERWSDSHPFTREEMRSTAVGVVTSSIAYQHVREVLKDASVLKLGITHPLPAQRIRDFAGKVDRLFVVEETDPYLEEAILALGIAVEGKQYFPRAGELTPESVRHGFIAAGVLAAKEGTAQVSLPAPVVRPPVLCPGCPHVTPFLVLRELEAYVTGDIGCYTLGASEPLRAMDTCLSMGSSIGMAVGMWKAGLKQHPIVAAIGDSTFVHAGLSALVDAVWNNADITVVILDNGTTAMTGGQPTPEFGSNVRGTETPRVDIAAVCRAIGADPVMVVDPYDVGATHRTLLAATRSHGVSVVITSRPCVQAPKKLVGRRYSVETETCVGCQLCMNTGCPALVWDLEAEPYENRRRVRIDQDQCTGCTVCSQICPQSAIVPSSQG